jgi:hypothetical protein
MLTESMNSAAAPKTVLHRGYVLYCVLGALLVIPFAVYFINLHWPYRYRNVEPTLQKVFASQIKIDHYHRVYFPSPGFVADGLTLRRNSALNLPPVGSVDHVQVEGRWIDLLLLRNRIRLVRADGLHVVIPPVGSAANKEDFPPGSSGDFTGPTTVVEQVDFENALLDILRTDGSRYSFPIRQLMMRNLQKNEAVRYSLDMQNAKPSGRIQAHGSLGPLLANQLDKTPVTGDFTFTSVRLADIHGISGMLTAKGRFHGNLGDIEASAESDTPDFAVGKGQPTAVTGTVSGAINALNGNILLHAVDVHIGKSVIHAEGDITGAPKVTNLNLSVKNARAEDILRPFLQSRPPVAGAVQLHSHATVAAAEHGKTFLQRLTMNGAFDVPAEHVTNVATERNLTAFSQRAQGVKAPTAAEDESAPDVISSLAGTVLIRNGVATATRLTFEMPGAFILLNGDFNLRNQNVHMLGDLRMQTDISHVTSGFKSLLLKPLAPFFKKRSAGAVVPIAVTGSPGQYKVSQNVIPH